MSSKNLYIILALINKIVLPSYSRKRLNLSKANKLQLGIIYWRYIITRKALKKKTYKLLVLFLLIISCETVNKNEFAIVIHGGAFTILKENMNNELENAYKDKMKEALEAGYYILETNGTSIDAVEAAIKSLRTQNFLMQV